MLWATRANSFGILSFALLLGAVGSAFTLRSANAADQKDDAPAPKNAPAKKTPHADLYDRQMQMMQKLLEQQPGFDPKAIEQFRKTMEMLREQAEGAAEQPNNTGRRDLAQLRRSLEMLRKMQAEAMANAGVGGFPAFPQFPQGGGGIDIKIVPFPGGVPNIRRFGFPGVPDVAEQRQPEPRLGVQVEVPLAVLTEQLELPKGEGLVIAEVMPGTTAAKAGLKQHDILLEIAGQPVLSDVSKFTAQLAGMKADDKIEVVVLRKGRKETLKDVTLAETK